MKNLIILNLCIAFWSMAAQDTIYVDHSANGTNDGSNWNNAYPELSTALITAQSSDQIWVAAGTYIPQTDSSGNTIPVNPRKKTFTLKNNVKVFGGFISGDTSLSQRNWTQNVCILSGDIGVSQYPNDNVLSVVTNNSNNLDYTARLDGFLIRDGYHDRQILDAGGGGIYNRLSSPFLCNLILENNYAKYRGGGIFNKDCSPYMANIIFRNNIGMHSGGGITNMRSGAIMINCLVYANVSGGLGVGLYNYNNNQTPVSTSVYNSFVFENYDYVNGNYLPAYDDFGHFAHHGIVVNSYLETYNNFRANNYGDVTASYCMMPGTGTGSNWDANDILDGSGNQDTIPEFTNAAMENFYPTSKSLSTNRGLETALPADLGDYDMDGDTSEYFPVDILNRSRIYGGKVDVGPFERRIDFIDTISEIACSEQRIFGDIIITQDGDYTYLFQTSNSDSLITLNVTFDIVKAHVMRQPDNISLWVNNNDLAFQWYDCVNDSLLPDSNIIFTPINNGSYAAIVTNANGCSDTSKCFVINSIGMKEWSNDLRIYPNPATQFFTISADCEEELQYEVINNTGQNIKSGLSREGKIYLEMSKVQTGIYYLQLNCGDYKYSETLIYSP